MWVIDVLTYELKKLGPPPFISIDNKKKGIFFIIREHLVG